MRSYLYVPGNDEAKLARAWSRGADALIVDLEDAVALPAKDNARKITAAFVRGNLRRGLWVRINPLSLGYADEQAVVAPGLTGLCVAKAESVQQLRELDSRLSTLELAAGLPAGSVKLAPLLESAAGILAAPQIAKLPRVTRLQLGEADLAADMNLRPGPEERELLWARSMVVAASAAAGIDPPVAPVPVSFRDPEALRESTQALRRLGFYGRACIHPAQIAIVNDVFTPTPQERAEASDIVARYEAAIAEGVAVCVGADGKFIDLAVVRAARRTLAV